MAGPGRKNLIQTKRVFASSF